MTRNKILVFTSTRERNGTAQLRNVLARVQPDRFVKVESYWQFFTTLLFKRKQVQAVFALSTMHFFVAQCFTRLFFMKVPVVLGMFHPYQWKAYFLSDHVPHRKQLQEKLAKVITHQNIIHSSKAGVEATNLYCTNIKGTPNISQGPAELFEFGPLSDKLRNSETITIVTVGRLVDFKVVTVMAMIRVIKQLVDNGIDIYYDVYGDGISSEKLQSYIDSFGMNDRVQLKGILPQADFRKVVSAYNIFFGMAGAVIQAASAGVTSIIAIQGETEEISYGFFSGYDHHTNPIFGDKTVFAKEQPLKELLIAYHKMNGEERVALAEECSKAAFAYDKQFNVHKMLKYIEDARPVEFKVTIWDLVKIYSELIINRKKQKDILHT